MPFEFIPASIEGLWIIQPKRFRDDRGYFEECYQARVFSDHGISKPFVQDNQSYSQLGTIRGLHFQKPPHAQAKLVRAVTGKILDVAVDIRLGSKTYGDHFSIELDAADGKMLYVGEGLAHGFAVLSDDAIVHYKTTDFYNPKAEYGIIWNDPDLGIDWKIQNPSLSPKDKQLPSLKDISEYQNIFKAR
jgi:dTDP-4-dehydrorhamnose 3,5-epimerase